MGVEALLPDEEQINTLCSICCKSARKRIGGGGREGKGTGFESFITFYVAHSNDYVMYYTDFAKSYLTCHITEYITTRALASSASQPQE